MFAFYMKVLGLGLAVTNFVLLMVAFVAGPVHLRDFLFLNGLHFLMITLIFIFLDLSGRGASRISEPRVRKPVKE